MIVSPEKQCVWHHNLFKQTRYWILKPQTHTHHHNPKTGSQPLRASQFHCRCPEPFSPEPNHVHPGQTRQKPCPKDLVSGGATRYNSRPGKQRRATRNRFTHL